MADRSPDYRKRWKRYEQSSDWVIATRKCVDAALWRSRLQEERELELAQRVALTVWTMFAVMVWSSWERKQGELVETSPDRMPLPNMWFRN